jgi:hypothetical protein
MRHVTDAMAESRLRAGGVSDVDAIDARSLRTAVAPSARHVVGSSARRHPVQRRDVLE